MSTGVRITVLTGREGQVHVQQPGTSGDAAGESPGIEWVSDLHDLLDQLSAPHGPRPNRRLVAIAPDVPQPLAAARRIRELASDIAVAFLVPDADVRRTRTTLAMLPELADADVVGGWPSGDLRGRLHEAAGAVARRGRLQRALDVMNADLRTTARDDPTSTRQGVSERYLAALTRHAPDAIISVDADGRIVASNAAAGRILELRGRDAEGAALEEVVRAVDPDELHRMVGSIMGGVAREGAEVTIRRRDGSQAILSVTAAPVVDADGTVAGAVFIARDITDRRRTDERLRQLQQAEGLATLAAGVAHDFNNLLVVVQGWVTLAAADPTDTATVAEALEHIGTASVRAAELARAMLAYGGRGEIDPAPCDVSAVVAGMRRLFDVVVPKHIDLQIELSDDLPTVRVDDSQLRQVVMNLVTNAAEAIGGDPGTIRVRTVLGEATTASPDLDLPPGGWVAVEVIDSGPGMDQQTAARVFEAFFTTKFVGRGLGLAASFGIARAHGGTITVDSPASGGSCFRLILPTCADAPRSEATG